MDDVEQLRKGYRELIKKCEKCTSPSRCPTCRISEELVEISLRLDAKDSEKKPG
jgi:hypothetical protein